MAGRLDRRRGGGGVHLGDGQAHAHADPGRPRDLEGVARGHVLHAPQVREVAVTHGLHYSHTARGAPGHHRDHGEVLIALLELTKPRITQLVLLTAAAGFYLGAGGQVDLLLLAHTLLGTALVAGG